MPLMPGLKFGKEIYIKIFANFFIKVLEIFRICAIIITELALEAKEC